MDQKIREKMIKCLELTASDADGEALNAIRMANKQREKLGMSWEQVLNGSGASNSRGGRPGAGSYDYYNTDPFSEGMARARRQAEERQRQEREREQREQAQRQRAWNQQQENTRRQDQANSQRRNSRASASDDFGSAYQKPNDKTFKDWDDVWGV